MMSSELEDFLKRAAQRRAEHVAVRGEQQQRAQKRNLAPQSPEYTDRNRERAAPAYDDDDEIFVAEVVQPDADEYPTLSSTSLAEHHVVSTIGSSSLAREAAKGEAVDRAYSPSSSQAPSNYETWASWSEAGGQQNREQAYAPKVTKNASASGLLQLLKSPLGVKQAFLMREILDRPSSRW